MTLRVQQKPSYMASAVVFLLGRGMLVIVDLILHWLVLKAFKSRAYCGQADESAGMAFSVAITAKIFF